MDFSNSLITWYLQNKRDLPWRNTTNPYAIWLSEIILQQTRVAQGLPYFERFLETFPSVFDLANASEQEVLKLWQGLGYYSRARNLHTTAKGIAFEKNGEFPTTYNEIIKLKGIGSYTAAAIASFAFNEVVPVVDGNVFRVLARFFDIETDISSNSAKKEFFDLASKLIPKENPALFNQAIMEFGALQCVPKNPDCEICPLNSACLALKNKKVAILPIKLKKTKVVKKFFNYFIFEDSNQNVLLYKRVEKGIWQNLYEFALVETEHEINSVSISSIDLSKFISTENIESIISVNEKNIIHKLSHQELHIKFWKVEITEVLKEGISIDAIKKYPFPIVIHNFIEKHYLN